MEKRGGDENLKSKGVVELAILAAFAAIGTFAAGLFVHDEIKQRRDIDKIVASSDTLKVVYIKQGEVGLETAAHRLIVLKSTEPVFVPSAILKNKRRKP